MTRRKELPVPRQTLFWVVVAGVLIFLVWLLRGLLLPFILGMALAYVGDPVADRLERVRIPRSIATLMVLGLVVGIGILAMVLVLPLLVNQLTQLVQHMPHYIDLVRHRVMPRVTQLVGRFGGPRNVSEVQKAVAQYVGTLSTWALDVLGQVWSGGLALADIVYVMLLTPLVAFYFLRDWDLMAAKLDSWIPRKHTGILRGIAREINEILAGFIRGQATVCLIFAIYYSVALSLAGLEFAVIIGTAAGVLTFIPYLGAITGLLASVIVAMIQFSDYSRIAIVAGVYLLGHLVEANIVTPTLVGDRVKLHPLWIIFALAAGGALFGVTGVLMAVPVAAVVGVVVRFAIREYLASGFYDNLGDSLPIVDPSEL